MQGVSWTEHASDQNEVTITTTVSIFLAPPLIHYRQTYKERTFEIRSKEKNDSPEMIAKSIFLNQALWNRFIIKKQTIWMQSISYHIFDNKKFQIQNSI